MWYFPHVEVLTLQLITLARISQFFPSWFCVCRVCVSVYIYMCLCVSVYVRCVVILSLCVFTSDLVVTSHSEIHVPTCCVFCLVTLYLCARMCVRVCVCVYVCLCVVVYVESQIQHFYFDISSWATRFFFEFCFVHLKSTSLPVFFPGRTRTM